MAAGLAKAVPADVSPSGARNLMAAGPSKAYPSPSVVAAQPSRGGPAPPAYHRVTPLDWETDRRGNGLPGRPGTCT